ncbi:hypothetical protein G6F40_016988 [Rhizopus arrhizus]|nr:hypothetical protein G6F24_016413 [Rhizopus arrhizus]KAG1077720.1 hypothetical protein G6F40_016988 [Rhizopus arrhizus]
MQPRPAPSAGAVRRCGRPGHVRGPGALRCWPARPALRPVVHAVRPGVRRAGRCHRPSRAEVRKSPPAAGPDACECLR